MEFPKVYDVVGYVIDGSIYCPDCAGGKGDPIFRSDEFDYPPVCENEKCRVGIDASLTTEGKRVIAEWFEESGKSLDEFREEMYNQFGEAGRNWVDDAVAAGFIEEEEPEEGEEEEGEPPVLMKMKRLHAILRKIVK